MKKRMVVAISLLLMGVLVFSLASMGFAEEKKITVLTEGADVIANAFRSVAPEFKKLTGYDVEIVTSPYIGIFDKMTAEVNAPTGAYDVALIDILWIPFLAHGLMPIDHLITSSMKADFYPGLLSGGSYNGTTYGMPAWTNNKTLIYRKDLFEDPKNKAEFKKQYGYELKPPSTWKEFRDAAKFFTRDENGDGVTDLYGTVLFAADADGVTQWLDFALQAGAKDVVTDAKGRNALATDPKPYVEALRYMYAILKDRSVPAGVFEFTVPQAMNMFNEGKVAMMLVWGHFYIPANDPKSSKVAGKVAVAPMISGEGGMGAIPGPWYLVIPKSAKHKDIAEKFLTFMYEKNSVFMQPFSLGLAARKSVFDSYVNRKGYEHVRALMETLAAKQTKNRPAIKQWEQISQEALLPALQYALRGQKTPEAAVQWAAEMIDEILAQ